MIYTPLGSVFMASDKRISFFNNCPLVLKTEMIRLSASICCCLISDTVMRGSVTVTPPDHSLSVTVTDKESATSARDCCQATKQSSKAAHFPECIFFIEPSSYHPTMLPPMSIFVCSGFLSSVTVMVWRMPGFNEILPSIR